MHLCPRGSTQLTEVANLTVINWTKYIDDVIKWKHFPRHWPFVRGFHRSPVKSPHKGQRSGDFMFSLICAWINAWVNNREAGDLRRHRAHYGVTVMLLFTIGEAKCITIICGIDFPVNWHRLNFSLIVNPLAAMNYRCYFRHLSYWYREYTNE